MWADLNAFLLLASVVTNAPTPVANVMVAPTTLSIGDLVVLAWIPSGAAKHEFLRWDEAKSKGATQNLDLGEALPIANLTCNVRGLAIKSCKSDLPQGVFNRLYRPFLHSVRFSPSEVNLSGTQQRIVAISIARYVDRCAGTICSFTPPPPLPPPADAG